jgi:DNA-binding HxlR family transcriptional regulator
MGYRSRDDSNSYKYQLDQRNANKEQVLILLEHGPKRFREILDGVEFTQQTLSSILKELSKEGKIQKVIHEDAEAYEITAEGKASLKETYYILHDLVALKDKGAIHLHNDNLPGISASITTDISKKNLDNTVFPISPDMIIDMSFDKMIKEIGKENIDLSYPPMGKYVISLTIDYSEFFSFVKALRTYMKELPNKELRYRDFRKNEEIFESIRSNDEYTKYVKEHPDRIGELASLYHHYASRLKDRKYDRAFQKLTGNEKQDKAVSNADFEQLLRKVINK